MNIYINSTSRTNLIFEKKLTTCFVNLEADLKLGHISYSKLMKGDLNLYFTWAIGFLSEFATFTLSLYGTFDETLVNFLLALPTKARILCLDSL